MSRREKANWAIAIVGLIGSMITIFAFVTGIVSISGMSKKQEPPAKPPAVQAVQKPPAHATRTDNPPILSTKGVHKVLNGITRPFQKHTANPSDEKPQS